MNPVLFKLRGMICLSLLVIMTAGSFAEELSSTAGEKDSSLFPKTMTYEGIITNTNGESLPAGRYNFVFSLYTEKEGGTPVWTEKHQSIEVVDGYVQLLLGQGTEPKPLDLPFDRPYYLGISFGDQPELTPRMELTTSGFAFRASIANDVRDASITSDKIAKGAVTDDKIASMNWNKLTNIPVFDLSTATSASATGSWSLRGNIKTNPPIDFVGTTDDKDLVLKTDNTERLRLGKEGNTHVARNVIVQDDYAIGAAVVSQSISGKPDFEMRERIQFDENGDDIEMMGADVGIGTEEPKCMLHVKGTGTYAAAASVMTEPLWTGETAMEENHIALFENTESGDGIAIQVNEGTPSTNNNYITFLNGSESIVGRIEGETLGELHFRNWEFLWSTTMYSLDFALTLAEAAASAPNHGAEVAVVAANAAKIIIEYIEWEVNRCLTQGVNYASSAGDYAEYLERLNPDEIIHPGDIVGVFGGKITKQTMGAQQIFTISTAPIVLGNMPDKARLHLCEKVAFMGQVPVRVIGRIEEGDYIIPSGLGDGTGVAVAPELMTAEEYCKVVGRAWSASDNDAVKLINMAIGLNSGDIARFVGEQHKLLQQTRSEISSMQQDMLIMKQAMHHMVEKVNGQPLIQKTNLR